MALSEDTKKRLVIALTDEAAGQELADAVDAGSNPKAATVAAIGTTVNLPAVAATFATLADARSAVEAQRAGAEPRLDAVEAKIDAILAALKAAGLMAS
jgi:hypothetical protein